MKSPFHPSVTHAFNIMKLHLKFLVSSSLFLLGAALASAAPAAENWENHCAKCHGADGKGQTKIGKKLSLLDYTDAKVQADMKDADMAKIIAEGVKDKAGKDRMKPFKEKLTDAEIKELIGFVRTFKK